MIGYGKISYVVNRSEGELFLICIFFLRGCWGTSGTGRSCSDPTQESCQSEVEGEERRAG